MPKKPAYLINVFSTEDGKLISSRLGAAWESKKGNFRMHLSYYSTQPGGLVYLRDPEQEEPTAALAQHLRRRDQGNCTLLHRVFSAKTLAGGKTLPYPSANCSLYFAPIEKPEPANKFDPNLPFGEERGALNEEDFI